MIDFRLLLSYAWTLIVLLVIQTVRNQLSNISTITLVNNPIAILLSQPFWNF